MLKLNLLYQIFVKPLEEFITFEEISKIFIMVLTPVEYQLRSIIKTYLANLDAQL